MRRMISALTALALIFPASGNSWSQDVVKQNPESEKKPLGKLDQRPTSFWPDGVEWNSKISSPRTHLGFDIGFRHLEHWQVVSYLKALANESDRVTLKEYGRSHGGRPLLLATITHPDNHARLKQIQRSSRRLAKVSSGKVDVSGLPAVINMGYGVHGDESSATNCAPLVAYYLAAAQGDDIDRILKNCVVLLDPCLNPDGFNRFATWANRYRGRVLNADPQHAEHNQQWPPGRVNYYWFDLNRDWLPLVHPESRSRMRWYHAWKPNVVLDYHEMGTNSTYFFQPGIPKRTNPLTPKANVELTNKFGAFHAKALDERGSLYYTKESFDDFYMGKGSTYPDLHGAVGILFEQASSRGHVQENQDGRLTFYETIANHFATSLSSLKATVELRSELHEFKRKFYADSLEMGADAKKQTLLFSTSNNRTRLHEFAAVLVRHDIKCYWLKQAFEHGEKTFDPRWTLVVPTEQPEFRFLKSLMMRRTKFRENVFYDVSSWTLPLAFGLQQTAISKKLDEADLVAAKTNSKWESEFEFDDDDIAYLVDWRDDSAQRLLGKFLQQDVIVRVAKKRFGYGSEDNRADFGYGTLQIPMGVQPQRRALVQRVLSNAIQKGVSVTAVKTGLTPVGIDLGSNNFPVVKKASIAMVTGKGVSAYGAGEVWHAIDTRVGLPVTMIKNRDVDRAELRSYSVMVFVAGNYDSLNQDAVENVKRFAKEGGTVISIGASAETILNKLTNSKLDDAPNSDLVKEDKEVDENEVEVQKPFASASTERALGLISGAIFKTRIDRTHPLGYGIDSRHMAVFRNHGQFLTPSEDPYSNPLVYDVDSPLMAGYCSDENVEKFKGSASVVVHPIGKGRLILMSDNPNFRGFWHGTSRIFTNAVFFGDLVGRR